jgi:hypothetical protein
MNHHENRSPILSAVSFGATAFSGLVQTEATTVERIFLKKIRLRGYRRVHSIPENALRGNHDSVHRAP